MADEVEAALSLIRERRAQLAALQESAPTDADNAERQALQLAETALLTALALRSGGSISYASERWEGGGALVRPWG